MIDVKPEVRNLLLANADLVTALSGQKVYSVLAPNSAKFPYITLQEVTNDSVEYADNNPTRAEIRMQVDVWSTQDYTDIVNQVDSTLSPSPWEPSTAYSVNQFVANGGCIYQCTTPGVSATGGIGPSGTGTAITDGTVVWKYMSLRYTRYYSVDMFDLDPRVFHKALRYWIAKELS